MKLRTSYTMLVLLVAIMVGCGEKEPEGVNIVVNLPLTGVFAVWGSSIQNGSLLAMDDINQSSSSEQVKLNFTWDDNAGKPAQTVSLFQK